MTQNQIDTELLSDLASQIAALTARFGVEKDALLTLAPEEESVCARLESPSQPAIKLCLSAPARLGTLMDELLRAATHKWPDSLVFGGFTLRPADSALTDAAGKIINLTDKERDILCALAQAGAGGLEKDALLKKVWAYASNVETHTLETHIYRLRQKMEADPGAPTLLVNEDGVYRLSP